MSAEQKETMREPIFSFPDVGKEEGEIKRVFKEVFGGQDTAEANDFFLRFSELAKAASLVELSEDIWSHLENTDSYDIPPQDWNAVEEHAVGGHSDHPRDWQSLKSQYEQNSAIEAPIILKKGNVFHLVSGNTRLMVARALGIRPKVLLVEWAE